MQLHKKIIIALVAVVCLGSAISAMGMMIGVSRDETGFSIGAITLMIGFLGVISPAILAFFVIFPLALRYDNRAILRDDGTPESKTRTYYCQFGRIQSIPSGLMRGRYLIFSPEGLYYNARGMNHTKKEILLWRDIENISIAKKSNIRIPEIKIDAIARNGTSISLFLPNNEVCLKLVSTFYEKEILNDNIVSD